MKPIESIILTTCLILISQLSISQATASGKPSGQEVQRLVSQASQAWNRGNKAAYLDFFWRSDAFVFETEFFAVKGWNNYAATVNRLDKNQMKRMRYLVRDIEDAENGNTLVYILHNLSEEKTEAVLELAEKEGKLVCIRYAELGED